MKKTATYQNQKLQSFLNKSKLSVEDVPNFEEAQERVGQNLFEHYLNFQSKNPMQKLLTTYSLKKLTLPLLATFTLAILVVPTVALLVSRDSQTSETAEIGYIKEDQEESDNVEDEVSPSLEVSGIEDGAVFDMQEIVVTGVTEPGAIITLNGNTVENIDGSFQAEVSLKDGENQIELISEDESGNRVVKKYTIKYKKEFEVPKSDQDVQGVVLRLIDNGDGSVSWEVSGQEPDGYKLVYSKEVNPSYEDGDKYYWYNKGDRKSKILPAYEGRGTYYVRMCLYMNNESGGSCVAYSEAIQIEIR